MELIQQSLLSPDEIRVLNEIIARIATTQAYNLRRREYYEAHRRVQSLGISVPDSLAGIRTAIGWPGLVVDALDERLDVRGFTMAGGEEPEDDVFGLKGIFQDNELDLTLQEGHIEALIQGVAFETISLGDTTQGEPEALITIEPPTSMSGIWNPRRRALDAAAAVITDDQSRAVAVTLFLRDQTIKVDKTPGGKWIVTDRQVHNLGRVMVRRLVNRSWTSRQWGRSEITRPIIAATDAAMRTLLGAEVAREFYSFPQRLINGANEDQFKDAAGNPKAAWSALMGKFLMLPRDPDTGETATVSQLTPSSPAPFIDMLRMYAQLVAGEAALPPHYLGFETANPASADQIRAVEARHVKRTERRQKAFGAAHRGALIDAVMLRDGLAEVPDSMRDLAISWVDAATPTKAASADATQKLVAAGVLPADSEITLEGLGFSPAQITQIRADQRIAQSRNALLTRVGASAALVKEADPEVKEMSERRQ